MSKPKVHTLFEQNLLARKNDPETSKDAARKLVESGRLTKQEWLVYDVLKRHARSAGYTAKELAYLMNDKQYAGNKYFMISRRLSGLYRKCKAEFVTTIIRGQTEVVKREGCRAWKAI